MTSTALSSSDEKLRIEVVTRLSGVQWPTTSVILHFCARDPYAAFVGAIWIMRHVRGRGRRDSGDDRG